MGKGMDLAKALGKGMAEESPGESGDKLTMIAEDLLAAVKSGDAGGVAAALRAAHDCCAAEGMEE